CPELPDQPAPRRYPESRPPRLAPLPRWREADRHFPSSGGATRVGLVWVLGRRRDRLRDHAVSQLAESSPDQPRQALAAAEVKSPSLSPDRSPTDSPSLPCGRTVPLRYAPRIGGPEPGADRGRARRAAPGVLRLDRRDRRRQVAAPRGARAA